MSKMVQVHKKQLTAEFNSQLHKKRQLLFVANYLLFLRTVSQRPC